MILFDALIKLKKKQEKLKTKSYFTSSSIFKVDNTQKRAQLKQSRKVGLLSIGQDKIDFKWATYNKV